MLREGLGEGDKVGVACTLLTATHVGYATGSCLVVLVLDKAQCLQSGPSQMDGTDNEGINIHPSPSSPLHSFLTCSTDRVGTSSEPSGQGGGGALQGWIQ